MIEELAASPPAFNRSISSQPWGLSIRQHDDGSSSSSTSSTLTEMTASAVASSSKQLLNPHSGVASLNIITARSRTRSVGADGQHSIAQHGKGPSIALVREPFRGPGTPDITLDAFEEIRGRRNSPAIIKKTLTDVDSNELTRKRSSSDASQMTSSGRPRLINRLRSFISSFKASSASHTPTEEKEEDAFSPLLAKARSSLESSDQYERNSWQGKTAAADPVRASPKLSNARPIALIRPAARAAGPDGLSGLNDDSPPLTPVSDEAKGSESTNFVREMPHSSSHRHHWAVAQALSEGNEASSTSSNMNIMDYECVTPASSSTIASGRSSPFLSGLSTGSSASTNMSSRPASSLAMFKLSTSPFFSLLPSHTSNPSSSPSPPEHATQAYWHATPTSSLFTNLRLRLFSTFSTTRLPPIRRHLPALVFLMTTFIGSTICVLLALSTLPLHLPSHITNLTISEIRDMSLHLQNYSRSSTKAFIHTLSVLAAFYTWKQSFTIPGSLIMNVVFGAMYGTWMATLYTSILTSLGGVFCYLLMAPPSSLIRTLPGLHTALDKMQRAMQSSSGSLSRHSAPLSAREQQMRRQDTKQSSTRNIWTYLLILRILPIVPYGLMNIACSVLRVPLLPYAVTMAVGSIPWNACTVQVGELLVQVVSALDEANLSSGEQSGFHTATLHGTMLEIEVKAKAQSGARAIAAKIWNKEMMFKLILLSLISLAPLLLQRYLKRETIDGQSNELNDEEDEQRVMAELEDQEASVSMKIDEDDSLLSSWRLSWSGPTQAIAAAAATTFGIRNHSRQPTLNDSYPIKRFSDFWTMNTEERTMASANRRDSTKNDIDDAHYTRKYPPQLRAVTATRVD